MTLPTGDFPGFDAADHDAFRPDKWRSNQFNLERRRVRDKLDALGRTVGARLALEAGLILDPAITPENPTLWNGKQVRDMWLHFLRDRDRRRRLSPVLDRGQPLQQVLLDPAPWSKHLSLTVGVDLGGVEAGLALPEGAWLDRDNAGAVWEINELRGTLMGAVQALGEGWWISSSPVRVVRRFPRTTAAAASPALAEQIADALLALAPVYRIVAWSEGNDHIDLGRRMDTEAEVVRAHEAEAEAARRAAAEAHQRRAEEASRRAAEEEGGRRAADEARRRLAGPPRWGEGPPQPPASPRREAAPPPRRDPGPPQRRDAGPPPRRDAGPPYRRDAGGPQRRDAGPAPWDGGREAGRGQGREGGRTQRDDRGRGPGGVAVKQWAVGAEVLLGKGLLAGKRGQVKSQDGFTVTVQIGGLEVRVESRDLSPAGKER